LLLLVKITLKALWVLFRTSCAHHCVVS